MAATFTQVEILMRERRTGKTQEQAAAKANLKSRKTVAKYEKAGGIGETKPRQYRTRKDPFAEDWAEVEQKLRIEAGLEGKTLFEWLQREKSGKYQEGQLRTFQRRGSEWKALNVKRDVVLAQRHHPGEVIQTDGTELASLGMTVKGEAFKGLLIHSVLPYSNWEWGRVAQSESLAALQLGLQSVLGELGAVPKAHQTDNSTAATHWMGKGEGKRRGCNERYLQLLSYYGLEARTIHAGASQENGDIEASNGGLKRALEQHLLLRGNRDFESVEALETYIQEVMRKRNRGRSDRLAEEMAVMRPLEKTPLLTRRRQKLKVTRGSLIRVEKKTYSVPTGLIGRMVTVYIYEWRIEVWLGSKLVETLPRLIGKRETRINYRHVIDALLRKPGGFRDYRHRDDLFPRLVFRQAWEALNKWHTPRQADIAYLRILNLAAKISETQVAAALEEALQSRERWNAEEIIARVTPQTRQAPPQVQQTVSLAVYDTLLQETYNG